MIEPTVTKSHPAAPGTQRLYRFDNGFGASVVQFSFGAIGGSYGVEAGLWEMAVLRFTGDGIEQFELTYDTPITDDVIGHLDEVAIQAKLAAIRALPAVTA
jgi:hypothetical protein